MLYSTYQNGGVDGIKGPEKIGKGDQGKELLSLLDDEPFRLVYQNGLVESKDYSAVCECLTLRYGKTGIWGWSGR